MIVTCQTYPQTQTILNPRAGPCHIRGPATGPRSGRLTHEPQRGRAPRGHGSLVSSTRSQPSTADGLGPRGASSRRRSPLGCGPPTRAGHTTPIAPNKPHSLQTTPPSSPEPRSGHYTADEKARPRREPGASSRLGDGREVAFGLINVGGYAHGAVDGSEVERPADRRTGTTDYRIPAGLSYPSYRP